MKTTFLAILILCTYSTKATNYYFSSSLGDDNRTTLQAQNSSTPWKTLNKLNSFFTLLQPGDSILFKRDDIFYGNITIGKSGALGSPIVLSAYGSGAKPIITGFSTVSTWTNLGGNIYESTSAISTLSTARVVTINGVNTPMGRYPDNTWLTADAVTGTSITSSSLNTSVTNWTGAEVVIKKEHYIIEKSSIGSASGSTINFNSGTYGLHVGWGFFIQNDARTLSIQNEWYYDNNTKKVKVYSTATPATTKVSTVDILFYCVAKAYITVDGIAFTGANDKAMYVGATDYLTIQNCDFDCNYDSYY